MTQLIKVQDGGCWFCQDTKSTSEQKLFTGEFDANYHEKCLNEALEQDADNDEARIIKRELDESKNSLIRFEIKGPTSFKVINPFGGKVEDSFDLDGFVRTHVDLEELQMEMKQFENLPTNIHQQRVLAERYDSKLILTKQGKLVMYHKGLFSLTGEPTVHEVLGAFSYTLEGEPVDNEVSIFKSENRKKVQEDILGFHLTKYVEEDTKGNKKYPITEIAPEVEGSVYIKNYPFFSYEDILMTDPNKVESAGKIVDDKDTDYEKYYINPNKDIFVRGEVNFKVITNGVERTITITDQTPVIELSSIGYTLDDFKDFPADYFGMKRIEGADNSSEHLVLTSTGLLVRYSKGLPSLRGLPTSHPHLTVPYINEKGTIISPEYTLYDRNRLMVNTMLTRACSFNNTSESLVDAVYGVNLLESTNNIETAFSPFVGFETNLYESGYPYYQSRKQRVTGKKN